jgi:methylenetetrahydrofolate dehydrogenase (NADP+)/methenyltetrahydrofolate cyclohydrolase
MIIDGREISRNILSSVQEKSKPLGRELVIRAVVVAATPATESYLRTKIARGKDAGMHMEIVRLADDATAEEVIEAVRAEGADGVIVQLPLPQTISESLVLDEIPLEKDIDVLSKVAYEKFAYSEEGMILPPIVAAVKEVLQTAGVSVAGKRVAVVGAGKLVGQPVATWLEAQGANVQVITKESGSLDQLAQADIIVSGAGSPHIITPDLIKDGVVLIDAGTSESNGAMTGDAHPDCASKASVFTPVPGGIGPIVVACLFRNAAELALRAETVSETGNNITT